MFAAFQLYNPKHIGLQNIGIRTPKHFVRLDRIAKHTFNPMYVDMFIDRTQMKMMVILHK